jgi:hypothetical protein
MGGGYTRGGKKSSVHNAAWVKTSSKVVFWRDSRSWKDHILRTQKYIFCFILAPFMIHNTRAVFACGKRMNLRRGDIYIYDVRWEAPGHRRSGVTHEGIVILEARRMKRCRATLYCLRGNTKPSFVLLIPRRVKTTRRCLAGIPWI